MGYEGFSKVHLTALFILTALAGLPACQSASTAPRIWDLNRVIATTTLAKGEPFRSIELGNASGPVSQHLVLCRGEIKAHAHREHDETVLLLRGAGELRLGSDTFTMVPGTLVHIPAGTVHAFRATSEETVAALSCFSPAFDGKDRVFVDTP